MATRMAAFFRRPGGRPRSLGRFLRTLRAHPAALNPLATDDRPSQTFEQIWRPAMKKRVLVIVGAIGVWVVGIQARFVQLQVFQHETHVASARQQQERILEPEAPRGDIRDRHGRLLAYSVAARAVFADPVLVRDAPATATKVCEALGGCSAAERRDLVTKLAGPGRYVSIRAARDISPVQAQRIADLNLRGIALEADTVRYYPNMDLAAHILGFVSGDNHGQAGVELTYDEHVRGRPGFAVAQVNAKFQRLETRVERAPVPGADLELTIDLGLQHIVERELKRGVTEHGARGGTAVVMNPMTGDVLATASYPTFNANTGGRATDEDRMNRAVEAVYEPGSTFKIVTAAAALESGIAKPTDLIDCSPGVFTLPGRRPITEAEGHNYGVLSFEDVIVRSSNVGAVRIGLRTGAERLTDYVARFGFGQRNTRELPAVSRGIWFPAGLNDSGVASVSMGYQISVTPLQMVAAASAVANGGLLMQPRFVRAIERDGRREVFEPKVVQRAIQPETAATLTAIMEAVTERGTAKAARLDRYQVAGKTGTSQIALPDGRGYSEEDHNASFVGFVPSRRPVFTILVVIDRPRVKGYYGGTVAAPIFQRIAEAGLQYLGVPPTIDPVPHVIVASDRFESPAARRRVPMIIPAAVPLGGAALMPDVRGLSARDAMRTLGGAGLVVRLSGSGMVVDQMPEPGLPIAPGDWGTIHLARTRPRSPEAGDGR